MSIISDKLQLTLATKENIKREIEKKGITVGDVPFSDYPSKIASIGNDSDWKEPDWHDIINIRFYDTEDYQYKSIYLLDDSNDTIYLQGGIAYKTSDSDQLITENGDYTFTGEGDLECSKGYKTRWLIVYKNSTNDNQPLSMNGSLLYTIQDGINILQSFKDHLKLYFVDCLCSINKIENYCFDKCIALRGVGGLERVPTIGDYAFQRCINLDNLKITNCSIQQYAFQFANINELTLDNCSATSSSFLYSEIKKLNLKKTSTSLYPSNVHVINIDDDFDVKYITPVRLNYGYTYGSSTSSSSTGYFVNAAYVEYPEKITRTTTSSNVDGTTFFGAKEIVDDTTLLDEMYKNNLYIKKLTLTGVTNGSDVTGGFKVGNNCPLLEEINIVNDVYMSNISNAPMLHTLHAPNVKYIRSKSAEGAIYSNLNNLSKFELENLEDMFIQDFKIMQKLHTINLPKLQNCVIGPALTGNTSFLVFYDLPNLENVYMPNLKTITLKRSANVASTFHAFENIKLRQINLNNLENVQRPDTYSNSTALYFFYNVTGLTTLSLPKLERFESNSTYHFVNMPDLIELDLPNFVGHVTNGFNNLPNLERLNIPKLTNVSNYFLSKNEKIKEFTFTANMNIGYASYAFYQSKVERIIIEEGSNFAYSSTQLFPNYFLNDCQYLEYIYLPASITQADSTSTTNSQHIAYNCPKLTTIELGQGYSKTLYLKHITSLTKECVVNMLNALADLTGQTKQTLYIYSGALNQLSDEEKVIATNKNWTLAS